MDNGACVEVRAFSFIKEIFDRRGWPFPMEVPLEQECTAAELAEKLEIPPEKIEAVFVNGIIRKLNESVKPGDRVAFVPPGTPGPYRVILGIVGKKE
ncbi:MoaD/ThiS family protein [Desulfocucumis palustris]|uniref:MoaD/ThiS family protein n=1 Tax=Desulfocucumis palustris TaxID=1898651 RepID=UPI001E4FAA64|nr:MoaD/ThiS family protein [Desulfocucumis palustris]